MNGHEGDLGLVAYLLVAVGKKGHVLQKGPQARIPVFGLALLLHKVFDAVEQFLNVLVPADSLWGLVFCQQLNQAAAAHNVLHRSKSVLLDGDDAVGVD